jgi:hypothetical protein
VQNEAFVKKQKIIHHIKNTKSRIQASACFSSAAGWAQNCGSPKKEEVGEMSNLVEMEQEYNRFIGNKPKYTKSAMCIY